MADHTWVIVTMHDVRDYAVRNGLDYIVPFVEAACGAAERHLGVKAARKRSVKRDALFADEAVVLVLDSLLNTAEIDRFPSDNLKPVSHRRRPRAH